MAGKSCLLLFVLVTVSVFAAAHKPEGDGIIKEDVIKAHWNVEKNDGDGKVKTDVVKPNNLAVGLITIPSIPLPGADGSFHFQWGPVVFGYGFNMGGGLQFGGSYPGLGGSYPGQPMPYSQPYVVIPPYSQLYAQYMTPNPQLVPAFDPPHYGSYDPIQFQGDKAQSSFQKGSFGSPGTSN